MGSEEVDCADNCWSVQHGKEVCAIATAAKGLEAVPLWLKKCANYGQVQDEFGRTAMHIVASTGNVEALEWLVKRGGGRVDKRDKISGYTPLHRSLYFGNIHVARSLMKFNADINLRDNEGMTPFELCNKDCPRGFHANVESDPTELLVWGTNDNFTLGNVNEQERFVPEPVELFRKNNVQIMKVVVSTFHSVFLSQLGEIYVCGSGRNGILGNGFDKLVLQPEQVNIASGAKCISVAANTNHTLFLMENGRVFTCGLNEFGACGLKESVPQTLIPKPIDIPFPGKDCIEGAIAARYHSVFYTSREIFTCGLNRGQLGHPQDKGPCIFEPKLVSQVAWDPEGEVRFTHIAASNCATVARINTGIIYVFHKFETIKINAKQFDVAKMEVVGGNFSDAHGDKISKLPVNEIYLVIVILTTTGRIVVWRASAVSNTSLGVFSRVVFNSSRVLDIAEFNLCQTSLQLVTLDGEAYRTAWNPCVEPTYVSLPCLQENSRAQNSTDFQISTGTKRPQRGRDPSTTVTRLEYMKLQKIKTVYSALCITSDEQGKNFAIIQSSPKTQLTAIPSTLPSQINSELLKFLNETSEEDSLHDIVIQVGNRRFPAHLFIISSGCPKLHSLLVKQLSKEPQPLQPAVAKIPDMNEAVFGQILQFIYSHNCDLLVEGTNVAHFRLQDVIRATMEAARRVDLENMCKALRKFHVVNDIVHLKPNERRSELPPRRFVRNFHEDLSDITLCSQDGHKFKAHRCILVSRSEYFYSMLYANVWLEHSSVKPIQMQFSGPCLNVFLDYIYEDAVSNLPSNDFDQLAEILAMSDNLFLHRLRTLIEAALVDLLTLKNVASMIYLADRCNALQLKETCMDLISMNLPLTLETRLLDPLDLDLVKDIATYYGQVHPNIYSRRLKRPFNAPPDEEYEKAMSNLPEDIMKDMETLALDDEIRKPVTKASKGKSRFRSRASESEHIEVTSERQASVSHEEQRRDSTSSMAIHDRRSLAPLSPEIPQGSPPRTISSSSQPVNPSRILQPVRKQNFPNPKETMARLKNAEDRESKQGPKINLFEFPSLGGNGSEVPPFTKSNSQSNVKLGKEPQIIEIHQSSQPKKPQSTREGKFSNKVATSPSEHEPRSPVTPSSGNKKKTKWKMVDLSPKAQVIKETLVSPQSDSGRDPSNPWKISDSQKVKFMEIIQDEVDKRANFEKAVTKPLNLMQIEDQAINQLTARYRSSDVDEGVEIITVERVCTTNFAPPLWVQQHYFNSGRSPAKF